MNKVALTKKISFSKIGKSFNQEAKAVIFTIFNNHNKMKVKDLKKISLQYPMKKECFKKTLEALIDCKIIHKINR